MSHGGRFDFETETLVAHTLSSNGADASEDGTGRGVPLVFDTTQITSKANYSVPRAGDPCHPLSATAHPPCVAGAFKGGQGSKAGGIGYSEHCSPTLGAASSGTNLAPSLIERRGVRRLTPRECERLQGFPDDWTLINYRGKPAADSPRYRAVGNSMPVPVMRWIGQRIDMVEKLLGA